MLSNFLNFTSFLFEIDICTAYIQRLPMLRVGIWTTILPPPPPRHTDFKIGYLATWKCLIFHKSLHLKSFIHLFIGPALHLSPKYQSYHLLWRRETIYLIFTLNMPKPTRETVGIWLEWLQPFLSSLGHVICKPLAYVKECFTSGNLSPLRNG